MSRLSFMGIDGSGKTTLMQTLQRAVGEQASFLFSPDFHDISGFPGAEASRALNGFSRLADQRRDPALKLTSLYLRMCLFGAAEVFLTTTQRRPALCIERHPVIDALVYLPVYIGAVKQAGLRLEDSARAMATITVEHPEVAAQVRQTLARRDARLGLSNSTVEGVAEYCLGFGALSPEDFVRSVCRDFETTLPDRLLYLDVAPAVAFERIRQRGKALEAHESLENLTRLDQLAKSKFADLERLGVRCEVLPMAELLPDALLARVVRHFDERARR